MFPFPMAHPMMGGVPYMVQVIPMPITPDGAVIMPTGTLVGYPTILPMASGQISVDSSGTKKRKLRKGQFTAEDDDLLTKVMENHRQPMRPGEWQIVAREMGNRFTDHQCQERWIKYLKPPLDRSPMGLEERRLLVKIAVTNYGKWKEIAEKARHYKIRSATQVKNYIVSQFRKMDTLGLRPQTPEEVDCIPDSVFMCGSQVRLPKDLDPAEVKEQFLNNKTAMNERKWEQENFCEEEEEEAE